MLKTRIIPCLDVKDGRTVKGGNFVNRRDAGDPVELGSLYSREGADELVFLDITATNEKRKTLADLAQHDFIGMGTPEVLVGMLNKHGVPVSQANMRYGSESALLGWRMMQEGLGIAPMSEDIAVLTPEAERLGVDMEPLTVPLWLTTHRELRTSRRIRLVFDLVAEAFA